MVARGLVARGLLLADDIPPKVVSAKARVHESTLSRFFGGIKDVSEDQYVRILFAIREARDELRGAGAKS